jgi:hypothetical protein
MPSEVVVERVVAFAAAPARAHIAAVRRATGRDESDLCFSRRIGRESATTWGNGMVELGRSGWRRAVLSTCVYCFSPQGIRVSRVAGPVAAAPSDPGNTGSSWSRTRT